MAAALMFSTLVPAGAQTTTTSTTNAGPVIPASTDGIGKPPPGVGFGTKAALENPKCNADAVPGYGVFPFVSQSATLAPPPGGPFCVAPAPKDNGGATARGVTADSIKVVVVLATPQQLAQQASSGATSPKNDATGEAGTVHDAILDAWAAYEHTFELWGRKVDFVFIDSSGSDEPAQRADVVKIKAEKPFAVIDSTGNGLLTLQTLLAQNKIVVFGYGTSVKEVVAQAPYRWGQTDQQSGAINIAEFAGKQLVKRKAEYAGDDALKKEARAFGAIYTDAIDIDGFTKEFSKYGGKLSSPALKYQSTPGILGDPTSAQEQAPSLATKLKTAGVTSVFLFSDIAMNTALTKAATQQEYFPEWILTGYQFADLSLLARTYDQQQWAHAFGLSNLFPYDEQAPATTGAVTDWYWGKSVATSGQASGSFASWLGHALMYAGPTLTAKNVQKGFFATPAMGGAASGIPVTFQVAYGKTAGLPYDEYLELGTDFAPVWYDASTTGPSQVTATVGKGVTMYVNDAKRYHAGSWPKAPFKFFDKAAAIDVFTTSPLPVDPPAPCDGCPSQGGPGTPAAGAA
jgi:hypothetical protein